ncbi:MAG: patatin-like phospholipase family protein [Candidatus Sulfotelmatobacter sp.]
MAPETSNREAQNKSAGALVPTGTPKVLGLLESVAKLLVRLLRIARYAYLLRIPIVIAIVLFAFPFAALLPHSPLRVLFQNLFLLDGGTQMWPWPTFWSTMAAFVLAWSILLTSRIVLLNCGDRFNIPSLMTAAELRGWAFFVVPIISLPAILGQFTQQGDFRPTQGFCGECVVAIVAAAACSYILAFIALWCAVLLAPPHTQGSALTFPCPRFMKNWLAWADDHHVLPTTFAPGTWMREHLPCSLWQGYLANDGFLWSGHWLALLFSVITIGIYLFVGWWQGGSLGKPSGITSLTVVWLLLLNSNWVLSFFAFFLDRFRIPVLVPLVLFAIVSGNIRSSDCYFHVEQQQTNIPAVSPGQVLRARAGKPIVVIATAGGGIQAAAWTTQVLAGIDEQYRKWEPGKEFSENVALISSVSGGATGAMFYMSLYDQALRQHFHSDQLPGLTDLVSQSSLDDVAWALVYHDIPRIVLPAGGLSDRGFVLEQTWQNRAHLDATLSEWRNGVGDGWRPATIFNSTVAETGEPIAFSTTGIPGLAPSKTIAASARNRDFYDMYPGKDLHVVTAVRLAATFPFVTPAARPDTEDLNDYHMIDGGYYDNYGISSLLAWLEQGLSELKGACEQKAKGPKEKQACAKTVLPRILVLQIRPFPADEEAKPTQKGWAFQLYAPVKGLLSVRSTAQLLRDREALALFARRWESTDAETAGAKIQFATFEFGGFNQKERDKAINPPLSWAMSPSQIQAVKQDWNVRINLADPAQNDPNVNKVHCFFDPSPSFCESLSRSPE